MILTAMYVRGILLGFIFIYLLKYLKISRDNTLHSVRIRDGGVSRFWKIKDGELENLKVTEVGQDLNKSFANCGIILHLIVIQEKAEYDDWQDERVLVCKIEEKSTSAKYTKENCSVLSDHNFWLQSKNGMRRPKTNSTSVIMRRHMTQIAKWWNTDCVRFFTGNNIKDGASRNVKQN